MSFVAFSAAIDDRSPAPAAATPISAYSFVLGKSEAGKPVALACQFANRHGLITGATGSGKTRSLVRLASEFNRMGVPVFAPDMKGDLATLIEAGIPAGVNAVRLEPGRNFRLSLRRLGGDLVARACGLTDAQRGALDTYLDVGCETPTAIVDHPQRFGLPASERALIRGLNRLDDSNFGSASFDIASLISHPAPVTVLSARDIAEQGATYAVTISYLLRDLYQRLPEVGDRALPVLAMFIDEAHMLFADAPAELVREIERMVRLIRSRGVSLWFVTQSPADLPDTILAQLQNRIQHSLRAVTPKDWRGVRAAINSMPAGNIVDPVKALGTLAPGKAMVSLVQLNGQPSDTVICSVSPAEWHPFERSAFPSDIVAELFTTPSRTPAERPAAAAVGKPHAAADRAFWAGVGRVVMVILKTAALVLGVGFLLLLRIAGTARR